MSEDRIPSLIKIGAIPSSYGQKLHTDVIDPVTFSQRRVRFTLSRVAGFLHSNSKCRRISVNQKRPAYYW